MCRIPSSVISKEDDSRQMNVCRGPANWAPAGVGRPPPSSTGIHYRTSLTVPELLEPDVVYELRLDLWATANVFLPGHRSRLEVASSNFPRFGRNSNTGGEIASEAASQYRPVSNRCMTCCKRLCKTGSSCCC